MNDSSSLPNQNALMFEENEEVLCFQGSLLYKAKILKSEKCQTVDVLGSSVESSYYLLQFIESNSSIKDEWVVSSRILKLTSENLQKQIQLHEKFIQSIENNTFISKEELIKESMNRFSNSQINRNDSLFGNSASKIQRDNSELKVELTKNDSSTDNNETNIMRETQASLNNNDKESETLNSEFKEKDGILPLEEFSFDELNELYNNDYEEYSDSKSSSQEELKEQEESSCTDNESDVSDAHFEFPEFLMHKLCEDRENVVKHDKFISTPREITVKQILERWIIYQKVEDGFGSSIIRDNANVQHDAINIDIPHDDDNDESDESTSDFDSEIKDIYSEMAEGLMEHFDRVLIRNLLYTNEQPISHQNLKFSEIYGAEHLLRLLYQLPSFLELMKLTQHAIKELNYRCTQIMDFLIKNANEFFTTSSSTKTRKFKDLSKNAETRTTMRKTRETRNPVKRKRRKVTTKKPKLTERVAKRSTATTKKETEPSPKKPKINIVLEDYICENCVTTFSTQWRLGLNGERLCNACCVYERRHGKPRPYRTAYKARKSKNKR
ncbi:11810_t:CDS:10 [Ambispora gerdemannii]|uniref:Chromatin modification-related protein EAF3 n=1 Tax=Ambispora gerdemannii TaxID=144530 RepID=A0A9N8VKS8_9GLOM|nr:11810_t:CDS:10 [Ambispora gerdemannii]